MGVDDARDDAVVHVPRLPGDDLGDGDALVLGLVGEHRAADHVADGIDAGDVGAEMIVDRDPAALVERDAGFLRGRGPRCRAAGRSATSTMSASIVSAAPPAAGSTATLSASPDVSTEATLLDRRKAMPCFVEQALGLPGDLAVHAGQDAVEELDHGDLAAEPAPDRAELEADDAGADDEQPLRHRRQRQRAGRGDDALLVDGRRREAASSPSRWR